MYSLFTAFLTTGISLACVCVLISISLCSVSCKYNITRCRYRSVSVLTAFSTLLPSVHTLLQKQSLLRSVLTHTYDACIFRFTVASRKNQRDKTTRCFIRCQSNLWMVHCSLSRVHCNQEQLIAQPIFQKSQPHAKRSKKEKEKICFALDGTTIHW